MMGRELELLEPLDDEHRRPLTEIEARPAVVEAADVSRSGSVEPFSLTIHEGEVVGLAGLLGSGRTEVARLLFGADKADGGRISIGGTPVSLHGPRTAMDHGIAFSSENRRTEGLVADLSVRENIILALQAARGWARPLNRRRQNELVQKWIGALDIRPPTRSCRSATSAAATSRRSCCPLADHRAEAADPRRADPRHDVGAKAEIQKLVAELSDGGMAVLFISASWRRSCGSATRSPCCATGRSSAQLAKLAGRRRRPPDGRIATGGAA
jgi:simple sugar transport system ATP-binding protein